MRQRELYFYTTTINNWMPLLKDYNLEPIIIQSLSYLSNIGCIKVYGFVIMPNHIHLIWELVKDNGLESPVASFMKFTAHKFQHVLFQKNPKEMLKYGVNWNSRDFNFWQPKADWFLLNKVVTVEQKLNYIHLNPMRGKWSLVTDPNEYYFSSCRFYETANKDFDFLYHYQDYKG